jgi:hypothetical protein
MHTRNPIRLVALIATAMLLFTACGDDDTGTLEADDNVGELPEADAEEDATSQIIEQLGEECAFLGQFAGGNFQGAFDPAALFGTGGDTDLGASFAAVAHEFREAAVAAPEEITTAVETMAEAFTAAASELDGVTLDVSDPENIDPEAFEAFERLEDTFGAEFEAAAQEVNTFVEENCEP